VQEEGLSNLGKNLVFLKVLRGSRKDITPVASNCGGNRGEGRGPKPGSCNKLTHK